MRVSVGLGLALVVSSGGWVLVGFFLFGVGVGGFRRVVGGLWLVQKVAL